MWSFFLGLSASFLDKPISQRLEVLPEQFPVPDIAQRFVFELLVVLYGLWEDFSFYITIQITHYQLQKKKEKKES